jgi:hypothetical protein
MDREWLAEGEELKSNILLPEARRLLDAYYSF